MELDTCIKKRHSVRSFKTKKPDYGKIFEAMECAIKAPTAGNIPTLKFILVSDKDKMQDLADAATQDFIATAHYVVVICSDSTNCTRSYGDRGEIYSIQQAGAAIQNFLLKLTDLGLATCWVGAFSDKIVKRILKIPNHLRVEGLFPIGYEMGKESQRKKPSLESSLSFDVWDNHYMTPIRKPEAG
jgi:nitroreductase